MSSLRKKLPTPPAGHAWETVVTADSHGENILTLTLLDLATEKKISSREVNLTRCSRYSISYAEAYRRWSTLRKDTFNDLLGPVVDWVNAAVNKLNNAGQVIDYQLGNS